MASPASGGPPAPRSHAGGPLTPSGPIHDDIGIGASVTSVLAALKRQATGDSVSLDDILRAVGGQAYGGFLFAVAVVAISPVGAIPGASVLCASVLVLAAVSMPVGRQAPWLPGALRRVSVGAQTARAAIDRITPWLRPLDRLARPRCEGVLRGRGRYSLCAAVLVLALSMYPLALIPWAALLPAFAVALIGFGLVTRDGLIAGAGAAGALAALGLLGLLWLP